jgi:hypothetical protein
MRGSGSPKMVTTTRNSPLISGRTLVVRAAGFASAEVDGEVIALNLDKGMCYGLNPVGSRIWRELETPIAVADLCARLLREYRVDFETCEREVIGLLRELYAEGLVETRASQA